MKLHEYQSKSLFARNGIPIPKGRVAGSPGEARQISEELGGKVVIKAQVLVGGRGKAGGIRLVKLPEEVEEVATQVLDLRIKGLPVRKVLVDEAISISREIYLSIANDRISQKPILIASGTGGIVLADACSAEKYRMHRERAKQEIDG